MVKRWRAGSLLSGEDLTHEGAVKVISGIKHPDCASPEGLLGL